MASVDHSRQIGQEFGHAENHRQVNAFLGGPLSPNAEGGTGSRRLVPPCADSSSKAVLLTAATAAAWYPLFIESGSRALNVPVVGDRRGGTDVSTEN